MGTHRARQFQSVYEAGVVHIYANFSIGATGAPTLNKTKCIGIKSIVRNGTGDYTITYGDSVQLEIDKYKRVMFFEGIVMNSTASAVVQVIPLADNASSGTQRFVCSSATATAADPENGSSLLLHIVLKNSDVV